MKKYIVLYNPLSNKNRGLESARIIETFLKGTEFSYQDITKLDNYVDFMKQVPADTEIIFTGGDGTVNRMLNDLDKADFRREILYFPAGTGNDFLNDLNRTKESGPFAINEYLKGLPTVKVNNITCKFINGIGCGLDGWCCEEKDRLAAKGKKKSYSLIAAEGLFYKYKHCNARVTVDGVTKEYKKVMLAPTMIGRYYGGKIMMCPNQDRKNPEQNVTSVVAFNVPRLLALYLFPKIIKGKGPQQKKYMEYRTGQHVLCEFDKPVSLQIDGDTVTGVSRYEVFAAPLWEAMEKEEKNPIHVIKEVLQKTLENVGITRENR